MGFSIIAVCKLKGLREYLRHNEDESCFFVNGSLHQDGASQVWLYMSVSKQSPRRTEDQAVQG